MIVVAAAAIAAIVIIATVAYVEMKRMDNEIKALRAAAMRREHEQNR